MRIFISSVQKEFAKERKALGEYLSGDPLLRRFFESFIFERDIPASDRRPDAVYLDEVRKCDLYLGLFGDEYGWESEDGLSPTHLEFNEATRLGKTRLIFVKGAKDDSKHPKMQALIRDVGSQLVRRRFSDSTDLLPDVYASLIDLLETTGKLNLAPWDARAARKAGIDDLDAEATMRYGIGLNAAFDTASDPALGDNALVLRPILAFRWDASERINLGLNVEYNFTPCNEGDYDQSSLELKFPLVVKLNEDWSAAVTYKPKWDFLADSVRHRAELGVARTWGDRNQYAWSFAAEVPLTSESFKFKLTTGINWYF